MRRDTGKRFTITKGASRSSLPALDTIYRHVLEQFVGDSEVTRPRLAVLSVKLFRMSIDIWIISRMHVPPLLRILTKSMREDNTLHGGCSLVR